MEDRVSFEVGSARFDLFANWTLLVDDSALRGYAASRLVLPTSGSGERAVRRQRAVPYYDEKLTCDLIAVLQVQELLLLLFLSFLPSLLKAVSVSVSLPV